MASSAPLLEAADGRCIAAGGSTSFQTVVNIVVSIVGTGVLGLPYAFRVAGWLAGALGVAAAGLSTLYCMLLLVKCREKLEKDEEDKSVQFQTYGDLGAKAFGPIGRYLSEGLILVAQSGGSIAYLVFIGQNLSSTFSSTRINDHMLMPAFFIFAILLPLQVALSFIRSLSSLAPFSALANCCNVLAMALVIKQDIQLFDGSFETRSAFTGVWGLPFAWGVAVFCFEGFCMTLALEKSMTERKKYPLVLSLAFFVICFTYVCFGIIGYLAFGEDTKDIIILNLPNNWTTAAVKVGLCVALAFTFPVMMHPIHEIVELKLKSSGWFQQLHYKVPGSEWVGLYVSRTLVLVVLSLLASFIPGFGAFISFVGSTVCALLSFVLPALFHLVFLGSSVRLWQKMLDYVILITGLAFAIYGTYAAISGDSV